MQLIPIPTHLYRLEEGVSPLTSRLRQTFAKPTNTPSPTTPRRRPLCGRFGRSARRAEVDKMVMPKPPNTRGMSALPT